MIKIMRALSLLVGGALLAGVAVTAGAAESPMMQELIQQAKKEGKVTIWTPLDHEPMVEVLKVFEKKYGIQTGHRLWRGTATQQRTLIELKSGRSVSTSPRFHRAQCKFWSAWRIIDWICGRSVPS